MGVRERLRDRILLSKFNRTTFLQLSAEVPEEEGVWSIWSKRVAPDLGVSRMTVVACLLR